MMTSRPKRCHLAKSCMDIVRAEQLPAKEAHRICPKCQDHFMHDPAINIDIRTRNTKKKEEWVAKNREFNTYEKALRKNQMAIRPVDDNDVGHGTVLLCRSVWH